MTVYIDNRLIGKENYEKLINKYSNIEFVTDIGNKKDLEVLITMPSIVKNMNLQDYPKLKWIQYLMAGHDGVDLARFSKNGIAFCNAQNIFSKSIAEDVFTKIFYFNRNINYYLNSKKELIWSPIKEELELTNSTVLLIGTGSIGKEIAKRLKSFETYVIGYRKTNEKLENFDEIITDEFNLNIAIQKADYIIMAIPLTAQTKNFFDKDKFKLMKSTALFINVARGKVVNQRDMTEVLKQHKIRGAGLDVFEVEPLPETDPLWKLDNVYITPHNASSSPYMKERLYQLVSTNLDLYLNNKPLKYQLN